MPGSDKFLDALSAAASPRTIDSMIGRSDGVTIVLSDGKRLNVKRNAAKTLSGEALTAFVTGLLADG